MVLNQRNASEDKSIHTYIDFFAGAGGLSLGLGMSGWQGIFAIEKDPMAFRTFKENLVDTASPYKHFSLWPEWLSIEPHEIEDILEDKSIRKHFKKLEGSVTLVAGGPPCQGFSVAGARNGKDPRNLLVFKQIEAVSLIKPRFVLIENVGGFEKRFVTRPKSGGSVSVAEEALIELEDLGYSVGKVMINASEYGVPQLRKRVILFAIRNDYAGEIDAASLLKDTLMDVAQEQLYELELPLHRPVNAYEAISDLAGSELISDPEFPRYQTCRYLPVEGAYQRLMRGDVSMGDTPTSHRFNQHSDKVRNLFKLAHQTQPPGRLSKEFLYANGCHSNKRFVLDPKKPCSTLTTAPDEIIHYEHSRIVTLREMARIQSFPDDYKFFGRYTLNGPARGVDVPRNAQIGNAIPPLVGRALGRAIQRIMERVDREDDRLTRYRVSAEFSQSALFDLD